LSQGSSVCMVYVISRSELVLMPGNTVHVAYGKFISPLQKALSIISKDNVTGPNRHEIELNQEYMIHMGPKDGPVKVKGKDPDGNVCDLELEAMMKFMIISCSAEEGGRYRATTTWYRYTVRTAVDQREVFSYHWHPGGDSPLSDPHMHIGSAQLDKQGILDKSKHWTSGRITFESIVRLLIAEFEVKAPRNWQSKLDEIENPHLIYRKWSGTRWFGRGRRRPG